MIIAVITNPGLQSFTCYLLCMSSTLMIMLFIKSLQSPHDGFSINNFIRFATGFIQLTSGNKLLQTRSHDNSSRNFYFNCLPHIWNTLPVINYQESPSRIKKKLTNFLWDHFTVNFHPLIPAHMILLFALAQDAPRLLTSPTLTYYT